MKKVLLLALIVSCFSAFAQKNTVDNFKEGYKYFKKGDFKSADSLLEVSDSLNPNAETFYIHGLTKKALGDTCGYCKDMSKSSLFNAVEAKRNFLTDCAKTYYLSYKSDSSEFYTIVRLFKYSQDTLQMLYMIKSKDTILVVQSRDNFNGILMGVNKYPYYSKLYIDTVSLQSFKSERKFYNNFIKIRRKMEGFSDSPFETSEFTFSKYDDELKDKDIYFFSQPMPKFPGGEEARVRFLQDNLVYPEKAFRNRIEGTVYVTFVVNENGKVCNPQLLSGIGGGCDEASIALLMKMPYWTPGKLDGKKVCVQFNMPIRFTIH
ncbi:MAG: energy transducer TonB [Bacteroidota bacterium]